MVTPDDRIGTASIQLPQGARWWRALFLTLWASFALVSLAVLEVLATVQQIRTTLPSVPAPASVDVSSVVVDRNGRLLRAFTVGDGRWRLPVVADDVDPLFFEMLYAYEDRRFLSHSGVDWLAMIRAAGQLVRNGEVLSGGSTLTMQVARLIDPTDTGTLLGKLRQIAFAGTIETTLTKREIIDLYLLLAPYGGNLEGIRAATLAYFGKEPAHLSPAEAALLVALPQSPEGRRPDRNPDAAQAARDRVLDRMVRAGVLTAIEAEVARAQPVPTVRLEFPALAPHVAEAMVGARPDVVAHQLTIDGGLQASLESLAASRAAAFGNNISIAIVVADHQTGAILASVGSAGLLDADRDGFVDMTNALRSPGSTLKPLIYGLAFELGLALPETLIEDRPVAFGAYAPLNFDGLYRGTVTIRQALEQSLNVPAVIVLDEVGPAQLVSRLRRAGANPIMPAVTRPNLAVGLGGIGVTLVDLVATFGAIANMGLQVPLHLRADGTPIIPISPLPVLDEIAAWYVIDILAGVTPPAAGRIGRLAFKTGTSYGNRDAWAIGFDGRYVAGVWVGRPDGAAVPGLTGIDAAAPILFEAFDRLGEESTPLPPPPPGAIGLDAELPLPLQRFGDQGPAAARIDPGPEIAFPLEGVRVDLGFHSGNAMPLIIKIRNGQPPFSFLANGVPIGRSAFSFELSWRPSGPGFVLIAVIDNEGRSDRVTIVVE